MKALVVYHSKNGTTLKMAQEIVNKLKKNNSEVVAGSLKEITQNDIESADQVYLGCWTSGKFVFGQKPEKEWIDFANNLPSVQNKKTVLFTTYTIATGSMFRNMKKYILPKGYKVIGSMKSRNGRMDYYSNVILKYSLN
jgi:flavodoxin